MSLENIVEKFDELKLYKAGLIAVTGNGVTNKSLLVRKIIINIHDKLYEKNSNIDFPITIFAKYSFDEYRKNMLNLTISYSTKKIRDFYLIKKHDYKNNLKNNFKKKQKTKFRNIIFGFSNISYENKE